MFRAFASRFRRSGEPRGTPLLSVVVPVYDVEDYLAACLDSILGQSLGRLGGELEVVAVDDGSTDGSAAILARYADHDPRVHVVRQPNAGLGPARNTGVAAATGRYLTFVDSDDLVPPGALHDLVADLESTGSDFVVGAVRRIEHGTLTRSWTDAVVHARDRLGTTLTEFPDAVLDVIACNRVFRRDFWLEKVGRFAPGAYEDHAPMMTAYVRADRFDVLARVGYHWRIRETRTSISQRKADPDNLRDRLEAKEAALELLKAEADDEVLGAWAGRVVGQDLAQFLAHAPAADEDYRERLRRAVARYSSLETPRAGQLVRAHQKVRAFLAAEGDWDALERVDEFFADHGVLPSTTVVEGRVLLGDEIEEVAGRAVPPQHRELAAHQTELALEIARARWDGTVLELVGRAFIRGTDRTDARRLDVALCGPDGACVALDVEDAEVDWLVGAFGEPNLDYARGGFRTRVDTATLAPGTWTTRVRLVEHDLLREGPARTFVTGSSAAPALLGACTSGDRVVAPRWDGVVGFVLDVGAGVPPTTVEPPIVLRDATTAGDRLRLDIDGDAARERLVGGDVRLPIEDGSVRLVDPETGRPLGLGGYQVRVRRRPLAVDASYAARVPFELEAHHHTLRMTAHPGARVTLLPPLAADERGRYAQRRLELWARDSDLPATDGVHLDGVPEALVAHFGDGPRAWVVPDLGAPVPAGCTPLLRHSRAWHRSLATAGTVVLGAEPGPFWRKRAHQRLVLVLDEVPVTTPAAKGDRTAAPSAQRVRRETDRRNRVWDTVLVPDDATADALRERLGFTGQVAVGDPDGAAV